MTHICVGKLTNIGSDNGLSPERRQAIIWTNAGILLIVPLGTNFNEILIEIQTFSFENVVCEMLFISSRPQRFNIMAGTWKQPVFKKQHSVSLCKSYIYMAYPGTLS